MGDPMVVDLAHEAVSVPAETWRRWHAIARRIDKRDCNLSEALRRAHSTSTRRNFYWAATAARILVQWATGERQKLANVATVEARWAAEQRDGSRIEARDAPTERRSDDRSADRFE